MAVHGNLGFVLMQYRLVRILKSEDMFEFMSHLSHNAKFVYFNIVLVLICNIKNMLSI